MRPSVTIGCLAALVMVTGCSSGTQSVTQPAVAPTQAPTPAVSTASPIPTQAPNRAPTATPTPSTPTRTSPSARAPSWVPCPDAKWAVRGTDDRGELGFAMCSNKLQAFSEGEVLGTMITTNTTQYGASARDPENTFTIKIDDARSVRLVSTISTNANGTVRRQIRIIDRYAR